VFYRPIRPFPKLLEKVETTRNDRPLSFCPAKSMLFVKKGDRIWLIMNDFVLRIQNFKDLILHSGVT